MLEEARFDRPRHQHRRGKPSIVTFSEVWVLDIPPVDRPGKPLLGAGGGGRRR
jgi:hypothetical protein